MRTRIRVDPILPGLMDDEQGLEELLAAVASVGVKQVAVSTAFLRPAIIRALKGKVRDKGALDILLSHYESGLTLTMHGAGTTVMVPRAGLRRQIYRRVRQIGQRHGVATSICACKNGDLADGSCRIAGDWGPELGVGQQRLLFEKVEGVCCQE